MTRGGGGSSKDKGGRGGRGRPSGPVPRDVSVSKKLSWLLRHGAEKEGLVLGEGGYAALADVLANKTIRSLKTSLPEIKSIVTDNAKQRFSLIHVSSIVDSSPSNDAIPSSTMTEAETEPTHQPSTALTNPDTDPANYLIRANQGHSLAVSTTGLLTPITLTTTSGDPNPDLPDLVVHGTRHEAWSAIVASGGLKPMRRTHVHFATGVPRELTTSLASSTSSAAHNGDASSPSQPGPSAADATTAADAATSGSTVAALPHKKDAPLVLSGMRVTSTILMFLDLRRALERGIPFWISENGVVQSDGGDAGLVPLEVFSKVQERNGRMLVANGEVVAEPTPRGAASRGHAEKGR